MEQCRSIISLIFKVPVLVVLLAVSNVSLAEVTDISQDALMQRIEASHEQLILDVRSPEEYAGGHVPGAINIPHDQLGTRLAEISSHKNKEVVLYCRSGRRVAIAADILQSAGFSKLLHLDGDMYDWQRNRNLPVVKQPCTSC